MVLLCSLNSSGSATHPANEHIPNDYPLIFPDLGENEIREVNTEVMYVYRQQRGDHSQIGVCAALHVDDYRSGLIRGHEKIIIDDNDYDHEIRVCLRESEHFIYL